MNHPVYNSSADYKGVKKPYVPGTDLVEAVNLAIALKRPLLIQGEPGCGKTQLAKDVAFGLYYEKYGENYTSFYKEWFIKSVSKAKEGLYQFDNIARLRDAQLAGANQLSKADLLKSKDPATYVKYGPLGDAFLETREPCVVLIDEIDKADLDFPNDLLLELDEKRFIVDELKKDIPAVHDPVIIITSNNEKNLPPAFLRRCIFFYISFPDPNDLFKILHAHFPDSEDDLKKEVISSFISVREKLLSSSKNVSTSELINWFDIIRQEKNRYDAYKINGELPFKSVLLKTMDAIEIFRTKNAGSDKPI